MAGISVSPDNVAAEVNRDLFVDDFKRASGHYNGKGMDNGIHINATLSVLRNFKSNRLFGVNVYSRLFWQELLGLLKELTRYIQISQCCAHDVESNLSLRSIAFGLARPIRILTILM